MDLINDGTLWSHIIKNLAEKCGKPSTTGTHFGTDGDLILCDDQIAAENIADFLEMIGYDVAMTGTYDDYDGKTWYYIDVD